MLHNLFTLFFSDVGIDVDETVFGLFLSDFHDISLLSLQLVLIADRDNDARGFSSHHCRIQLHPLITPNQPFGQHN